MYLSQLDRTLALWHGQLLGVSYEDPRVLKRRRGVSCIR